MVEQRWRSTLGLAFGIVLAASLGAPGALGQESDDLEPSPFYFRVDDAPGDAHPACTAVFAGSAANPCDILAVEGGSTATHTLFRWTFASLTFPPSATGAGLLYRLHFTDPGGETYRLSVLVTAGGASFQSLTGDPGQAPGAEFLLDRPAKTLTLSVPSDGLDGIADGGAITFAMLAVSFNANGGVNPSGLYLNSFDTVPSPPDFILSLASDDGAEIPAETLEGEVAHIEQTLDNETSGQRIFIWNTTLEAAQLSYTATVLNGTALVQIIDGSNATVANLTISEPGNSTANITAAAPGNWSIVLTYGNFTGSLSLSLGPFVLPEVVEEPVEAPVEEEPTGFFPLHYEEKPAPIGLLPVALALTALAIVLRRRL
jgi:hypothetical protein